MASRPKAPPPPPEEREVDDDEHVDDLAAAKEALSDAMQSIASAFGLLERLEASR